MLAVGPTFDEVASATVGIDVTLAYLSTVRPFDSRRFRERR